MEMRARIACLSVVVSLVACSGPGDGGAGKRTIVIGAVIPDDVDEESTYEVRALRMALEEMNASGVFENEITLVNRTCSTGDEVDPDKAVQAVRDLFDEDHAVAFVSNLSGTQNYPVVELTNGPEYEDFVQCNNQEEDPVINLPGMTGSDVNDTFYRTVATYAIQIDVGALIFLERGWLKVGLYRLDDDFGQNISLGLRLKIGELSSEGASLAFDYTAPYGSFDVEENRATMDKIIAHSQRGEADVTIVAVFQAQAAGIIKYLTENGYQGALWLTVGSKITEMFQIAMNVGVWQEIPGNVMLGIEPNNYMGIHSEAFMQSYRDRFQQEPATHSSTAYDCAFVLGLSLLHASQDHPQAADVKAEMPRFKESQLTDDHVVVGIGSDEFARAAGIIRSGGKVLFDGASGKLLFDENGDRPKQGVCLFAPNQDASDWTYTECYDADMNLIE